MKLSARNRVAGKVTSVQDGAVASVVKVEVKGPLTVTSMITKEASQDLKLKPGDEVVVIIKSTEVIIAKE
jgi:molybdopterin-binding protein